MTSQTNWIPGLVVLAIAAAVGIWVLLAGRRRNHRLVERDEQLDELDRRAQTLIRQLKELEVDRHHLHPDQYASEKARLEALAAAAYRAKDEYQQGRPARPASAAAPPGPPAPQRGLLADHPQLKGALWGGGVVLFFVALGLLLSQEQKVRTDGDNATGRAPPNETVEQQLEESFSQALAAARENPGNLEASAQVVHELIRRQEWEEASALTERALGVDPFHVEHRVHRGLLLARDRDPKQAMAELRTLANVHPGAHEALLFVGALAMQQGDEQAALEAFERFAAEAPPEDQVPQLQEAIADLRQRLSAPPSGGR